MPKITLFSKTKELESQTDEFCNTVSEGALAFKIGIHRYLEADTTGFEEKLHHVSKLESTGDDLRREIQRRLYVETLIPESRGDVLDLLEHTDDILNACDGAMWQLAIEKPELADDLKTDFANLAESVAEAVEALVRALRDFFRGGESLTDDMHKVGFYESEADKMGHKLMGAIFSSDIDLSRKNQLRSVVLHIDSIADTAEDVSDMLAVFALKRAI